MVKVKVIRVGVGELALREHATTSVMRRNSQALRLGSGKNQHAWLGHLLVGPNRIWFEGVTFFLRSSNSASESGGSCSRGFLKEGEGVYVGGG